LRALADSMPAIAWSSDGEGNFDYFNRRLVEFTGDGSHDDGAAIHPDDFAAANDRWQNACGPARPTRSSTASAATTANTAG
jgi:PAS domain-containing protein